jgi:anaerobic selenocysteine-containing dehydrogenase
MDETTAMADLILPAHTYLERWRDDVPEPGIGIPIRTLAQPVVEPRFDTRDPGDVLLEVARSLGGKVAEALPAENFASMVRDAFVPLQQLKRGSAVDETFDGFWDKVQADGGWWDAEYQSSLTFQGPSQKFQFAVSQPLVRAPAAEGDSQQFRCFSTYTRRSRSGMEAAPICRGCRKCDDDDGDGGRAEVSPRPGRLGVAEGGSHRSFRQRKRGPVYVYGPGPTS